MKIGLFEAGIIALAGAALAVVGAAWAAVDVDVVEAARPLSLEVERLEGGVGPGSTGPRDLLSGSVAPGPGAASPEGPSSGAMSTATIPDAPVETWMDRAVAVDPFRPERQPGAGYRLPWERRSWAPPEVEEEDPPQMPEFRIVGIVVPAGNRGGSALIQREGEDPRLYRIGERIDGYELTDLAAEVAVLDGPAGVLNFMVNQPYAQEPDDRRRGRGDNDERDRRREEALRQRELQRARSQVINAIRRRTGGGNEPRELAMAGRSPESPVYHFPATEATWVGGRDGSIPQVVTAPTTLQPSGS